MQRQAICRSGEFKTRADDGKLYIEGYFATFTGEYRMWDKAIERVDRGAFDDTLGDDIRALLNHDTTIVLGRTTSRTLTLRVDELGLWGSILINQADQDAMNAYERVKRGDVSQCSFGFDILDEEYEIRDDGTTVWTIKKVKLYEVSVVTFPAYEDTMVEARKKDLEKINGRKLEQWRNETIKKLKRKEC